MFFWDFVTWFFSIYVAIACLVIFVVILVDVLRDEDLNGWTKALWVLFLTFVPFLAALVYLIFRRKNTAIRRARDQEFIDDSSVVDYQRP